MHIFIKKIFKSLRLHQLKASGLYNVFTLQALPINPTVHSRISTKATASFYFFNYRNMNFITTSPHFGCHKKANWWVLLFFFVVDLWLNTTDCFKAWLKHNSNRFLELLVTCNGGFMGNIFSWISALGRKSCQDTHFVFAIFGKDSRKNLTFQAFCTLPGKSRVQPQPRLCTFCLIR